MYEPMNVHVESVRPGLREFNIVSRVNGSFMSGLGRPIGCFSIIGIALTLTGTGIFVWSRKKQSEEYAPFKTFGSTFISLGLFIFVISIVLLCEAIITGRWKEDPDSTRSSREDLRSGFHSGRSFISRVSSRRVSDEDELDDSDTRSIFSGAGLASVRSYQTFPYPIPIVTVQNETGQTVLSKSL